MTILTGNDDVDLKSRKELSVHTKAVDGGVLHITTLRANGLVGVATTFVPTSALAPAADLSVASARDADGGAVVASPAWEPAAGAFALISTPGTATYLSGHAVQNGAQTDTVTWITPMPGGYATSVDLTVTVNAKIAGTGTPGTCTLAVAAYPVAADGTQGTTLIATAARAVTATATALTFTVTGYSLATASRLLIRAVLLVTETGNTGPLTGRINSVTLR